MVNGFALGGVAQGFDRAAQTGLQEDRVALAERQFESNEERAILEQGDKRIAESLRFVSDTIKQAKAAGASPEKIERLIAPVMKSIGDISTKIGRDPGSIINAVKASINAPVAQKPPEIVDIKRGKETISMMRDPRTGELSEIPGQQIPELREAGQEDDSALFGIKVPPLVSDINDLKAPVQKELFKAQNKAAATSQLLTELQLFNELVQNAQTGQITAVTLPMVQFFKEAGIKLREDIPALEAITSAQNQLALRLRNPDSGFGLTGNTSDRDVKFLKAAVGGLENTKEGNRAATVLQIIKMRREADLAALRAQLLERGAPQLFSKVKKQFIEQTPLFTDDEATFFSSLKGGASGKPTTELTDDELRRQLGIR